MSTVPASFWVCVCSVLELTECLCWITHRWPCWLDNHWIIIISTSDAYHLLSIVIGEEFTTILFVRWYRFWFLFPYSILTHLQAMSMWRRDCAKNTINMWQSLFEISMVLGGCFLPEIEFSFSRHSMEHWGIPNSRSCMRQRRNVIERWAEFVVIRINILPRKSVQFCNFRYLALDFVT